MIQPNFCYRGAADSEKAFRNLTQKPQAGGFIFF